MRAGGKTLSINRCAEVLFRRGRAVYTLEMENLRAELTCFVSPLDGAAIQLVRLRAADGATMQADVASFLDLCLAGEAEFESHPAFQRLLIQTQALGENMLAARRRPRRAGEEPVLACHLAFSDGPCRFYRETDRAAFLGRGGGLDAPQALARPAVQGRTGDVLGACFSLRAQLELGEGQARLLWFVTAAVDGEEQARSLCERYGAADVALQALALSETQASVAARYLGLDEAGELAAQRAAAYLLTPSPQNSAPPATKEALWQFSISGDLPVMAVSVQEMAHLPLAREAVRMHAYLRQLGVRFDLALINGQAQGYFQPLREALQALLASGPSRDAIGKPGGVTLLSESAYPKEALAALKALAALRLDGRKGSLGAQLAGARTAVPALKNGGCKEQALRPEAGTPALNNGYGGFLRDGSYLCYRMPPVPWCNVLVGAGLGAVMTDRGPGFVYAGNSRLGRLTAHPSDPVLDSTAEGLFLRDEESGAYASLTEDALALYAPGRMALRCDALGLHTSVEYFVDSELPVRCALITLENTGEAQRSVSVTSCVRFLLGSHRRDAMQARCRVEKGVCIAASPALEREAYLTCAGACEASVNAAAFYGAFPAGTPRAMAAPHLQEGDACGPFGAVRAFVALRPGESADVCVLLGVGDWEKAREAFFAGAARLRLNRVKKRWEERVSRLRALTPDTAISVLLGTWLPYQLLASRVEAKAGFQQAGGATGFRDQLQDMLALRYTEPETVRAHLLRAAAHQFEAGDVQHWWHEPALGVRTRITDDRLFLPFAAAAYARAAGDTGVFDELVPYLQDAPIPAGREDFYANIPPGPVAGTLREHCLRAIDSVRMGEHGLALMGAGDWNDGMNRVGAGGKGESVWLTFFLAQTLRVFAPYAGAEGARLLAERERLLRAAEESAWNGQWYLRAWFDDGRPLGGPDAPECQMDLLPQAWAVLAGAPHAQTALRAALNRLVDREHGIVRLLDPPFDGQSDPGYIRAYPPGVRENGGQYTHAAAWLVMACAQAGLTQEAWEIFTMLLPTSHTRTSRATLHYQGEPFVVAADVSSGENVGRAGWTWYTGSAGMLLRAGVEWLMGFEKEGDKIRLRPTAPKDWPGFTLEYRCEGTLYRLRAARGERDDGWIRLQGGAGVKEAVFALR